MAFDPVTAGLEVLNTGAQIWMNERNVNEANRQYAKQRQDALSDWNRNNQYNSPMEQMNRLRQAGLNPNLVYGKGAENTAAMVRSSSNQAPTQIAPRVDPLAMITARKIGQDIENSKAQVDNLHQLTATAKQEEDLKRVTKESVLQNTATSKWQLEKAQKFMDLEYTNALLKNKGEAQNQYINMEKNIREGQRNKADIENLKLQGSKIEQEKSMMLIEKALKQNELNLREKGISPNDPWYARNASTLMGKIADSGAKTYDQIKKWLHDNIPGWQ